MADSETIGTLYPPLIDTFMPAFVQTGSGKAYFSLSPYNAGETITRIHVSLVNQTTNLNAIKTKQTGRTDKSVILNGIWIIDMTSSKIKYNSSTNLYSITIPKDILKTAGNFSVDGYYKLQLRFDSSTTNIGWGSGGTVSDNQNKYLTDQRINFSEWSSVCLLKAIPSVTIALTGFDSTSETPAFNIGTVPIVGDVKFGNTNLSGSKAETLKSYEIKIYPAGEPNNIIDSSGIIYTADQVDLNHIYWLAGLENASDEYQYRLAITITTKNQYTTTKIYKFDINAYSTIPFEVNWDFKRTHLDQYNITTDGKIITEEDGIVNCIITTTTTMPSGYLYIKRASNLDNFKKWELISCTKHSAGALTQTFSDMTVGSLVQYQYSVQYQLTTGQWTNLVKSTDIIYPNFYDILLSRKNKQLAIRYKESVQNLKPVVNRAKIDTLGGKYPKFAENAQMNYKQYSISGLIDAESDFNRKFLDDRNYSNQMSVYDSEMNGKYEIRNDTLADNEYAYNGTLDPNKVRSHTNTVHDIYPKDNWWWEREFREEAIKWLNDGEPKLFRSMPEGNMSVMLTDISLTPEQAIGRRLYNFTATVYEIENGYSLETLNSLGIVDIINDKNVISTEDDEDDEETIPAEDRIKNTTVGQIYNQYFLGSASSGAAVIGRDLTEGMHPEGMCGIKGFDYLHTTIGQLYKYIIYDANSSLGSQYSVVPNSIKLKNLQIEFQSKPTWWRFSGNNIEPVTTYSSNTEDVLGLGYKIRLGFASSQSSNASSNMIDIFVNEKGFYQIPSNLQVTDLYIFNNAVASLNYIVDYETIYSSQDIPSTVRKAGAVVGQLSGIWTPDTYVSGLIQEKHKVSRLRNGKIISQTYLNNWSAINLELTPYSMVSLKYKNDIYNNYIVGRSGILNFTGDSFDIEEMYFLGRRMVLVDDDRQDFLDEWEYVLDKSAKTEKEEFPESNLTWESFVNRKLNETETLVQINGASTILGRENINRMWNNSENKELPIYVGYDSNTAITNPKYNTVYGIKGPNGSLQYKIFYIDNAWYDIEFLNNSTKSIAIAKVPVYGMINYKGTLITKTFN